jgi:hypothetical protein
MVRSASRLTLCGAIFDAAGRKAQLAQTEELIHAPDFWSQPEKSQKAMRDRKRIEDLSQSVDTLWHSPETSAQDRKHILRCVVQRVS